MLSCSSAYGPSPVVLIRMTALTPAPLPLAMSQKLHAFASAKLSACASSCTPFPWIEVEKLLPTAVMDAINHFFPSPELMTAMPEGRTGNAYAHRYRRLFPLNPDTVAVMSSDASRFWLQFDALIQSLIPELMGALPEPPSSQKHSVFPLAELKARIDLWADCGGYQIQPHTDAPHKLATFLLYCSADPSLRNEGTSIFVPKQAGTTCWIGRQWPIDDFVEVHCTPYGSNRLFGFRKTDSSFHGKRPVNSACTERRTIAITIQHAEHLVR